MKDKNIYILENSFNISIHDKIVHELLENNYDYVQVFETFIKLMNMCDIDEIPTNYSTAHSFIHYCHEKDITKLKYMIKLLQNK